jgi:hypothetical protein
MMPTKRLGGAVRCWPTFQQIKEMGLPADTFLHDPSEAKKTSFNANYGTLIHELGHFWFGNFACSLDDPSAIAWQAVWGRPDVYDVTGKGYLTSVLSRNCAMDSFNAALREVPPEDQLPGSAGAAGLPRIRINTESTTIKQLAAAGNLVLGDASYRNFPVINPAVIQWFVCSVAADAGLVTA